MASKIILILYINLLLSYFIERYFLKQLVSNFHASPELISPKSVAHFFPKSVAHFPKVRGSFSQSPRLIFPKSVAHFPKVGGSFSQSRRLIFPKSVAHFPKIGRFPDGLCQIGGRFFQVGKVCSVASICMGFGKAKGSLWT